MAEMNQVNVIGNPTREPELRQTESGKHVADIRLAVNRHYKTDRGIDMEDTCFVTATAWGNTATHIHKYVHKGSPVLIQGHLTCSEWEKDGEKRTRISITIERIQFLHRAPTTERTHAENNTDEPQDKAPEGIPF